MSKQASKHQKTIPTDPHDALFKAVISRHPDTLVRFTLQNTLYANLLSEDPVAPMDSSFVDQSLGKSHADKLLLARKKNGKPVYILVEHKSYPDPETLIQLRKYTTLLWEHLNEKKVEKLHKPPAILPLVFYHGKQPWPWPKLSYPIDPVKLLSLTSLHVACDLPRLKTGWTTGVPELDAVIKLMRCSHAETVTAEMLLDVLRYVPRESPLCDQVRVYIERGGLPATQATADEWDKAITRAQLEEWGKDMTTELRTLADVWMDRGEATGMAKGMAKTFLLLLNQRFGEVPPDVHSLVQDASPDSLEEWLRAIFDADSIDSVFNGNGRQAK